jgi:hypothetical protein
MYKTFTKMGQSENFLNVDDDKKELVKTPERGS